jgi:Raf kinase inhibitor-like YbhB/YbcL family protein
MRTLMVIAVLALAGPAAAAGKFTLTSPDLKGGKLGEEQVFDGMGCTGGNVSPALSWSGAPAGAKSFVLTVYDPDAPTGSGWWHWVVYDIPADAKELPKGAGSGKADLPAGAKEARTDFGKKGFGGACPPPGKPHRYVFTLFALKTDKLEVPDDASPAMIGFMTRANAVGQASVTATYGRKAEKADKAGEGAGAEKPGQAEEKKGEHGQPDHAGGHGQHGDAPGKGDAK